MRLVTHLNECGFAQPHVAEAIANHISGHLAGVAGVYNKRSTSPSGAKRLPSGAST